MPIMQDNNDLTEKFLDEPNPDPDVEETGGDALLQEREPGITRGEQQQAQCQDLPFAILYYLHCIAILLVSFVFGRPALKHVNADNSEDNGTESVDFSGILYLSLIAVGSSWFISAISLIIMTRFSTILVQFALIFSVSTSLVLAILALIAGSVAGAIVFLIFTAFGVCYACMVWNRIPFAAANLDTALTAVKTNYGVVFIPYFVIIIAFGYTAMWMLAVIGVYDQTADCSNGVCKNDPNGGYVFLLLLSYFWTEQVMQNIIHVTVAGVVGTWWFDPAEASSFCSRSIWDSFYRSITYSFGSICFGSLLVATLETLRNLLNQARRENGDNLLLCLTECLLSCLESLLEYFNKWAYIYVGLYGYSYLEAGKNVMNLFKQRGWTTIITDNLVSNVLSLMSFVIAGLTGLVGVLVQTLNKSWFSEFDDDDTARGVAFVVAFVIGLVISSILMSVVDSAVNTVIVAFAEAPAELESNHPQKSEKMVDAWKKVYPSECGF